MKQGLTFILIMLFSVMCYSQSPKFISDSTIRSEAEHKSHIRYAKYDKQLTIEYSYIGIYDRNSLMKELFRIMDYNGVYEDEAEYFDSTWKLKEYYDRKDKNNYEAGRFIGSASTEDIAIFIFANSSEMPIQFLLWTLDKKIPKDKADKFYTLAENLMKEFDTLFKKYYIKEWGQSDK